MRDWVPENHLVHLIIDAFDRMSMHLAHVNERGSGGAQYPPGMMLGLLIYSYATGVFSSRQIERSTYENVAVRVLCANEHPDHDTICTFRRIQKDLLEAGFVHVIEMAAQCQVLKIGNMTVAIDGTKILSHASKYSSVSYAHAQEPMEQLKLEIDQLIKKQRMPIRSQFRRG